MVLGLGVSHRPVVEGWYGQEIVKPRREMREYVSIVRAIFRGEPPPGRERWPTAFQFAGYEVRPDIPIYVAALSPAMLRLAGEIADGVTLWLCNHEYVRDVVVPEVTAGPRAGRQAARGVRHRRRRAVGVTDDPDSRRVTRSARPDPVLLAPVLPRDDRALGLRRRHRGLRREDGRRRRRGAQPRRSRTATSTPSPRSAAPRTRAPRSCATATPEPPRPCVGPVPADRLRGDARSARRCARLAPARARA